MILIADSGSTKTSWCFSSEDTENEYYATSGINPFFRDTEDIYAELESELKPKIRSNPHKIFFYGAGIVNEERGNIIKSALLKLYPDAEVETQSDLLAAARAALQNNPGIACILGTGSNSCLYDGEKIVSNVPPLGYVLGDEGSGTALGKKLLADYLRKIMPEKLVRLFQERFPETYPQFLDNVYRNEEVRKYLASFVPFLKDNIEEDYCRELVEQSFKEFTVRNIACYPGFEDQPVCCVGSVAYHFQEQLNNALSNFNLSVGLLLKEPLAELVGFHLDK